MRMAASSVAPSADGLSAAARMLSRAVAQAASTDKSQAAASDRPDSRSPVRLTSVASCVTLLPGRQ
jgi:hypothetical protein